MYKVIVKVCDLYGYWVFVEDRIVVFDIGE